MRPPASYCCPDRAAFLCWVLLAAACETLEGRWPANFAAPYPNCSQMGGGESKPAHPYADPLLFEREPGINQADIDRELRFERARTSSSLASAVATYHESGRDLPVDLAQVAQFTFLWLCCVVVAALYAYELADAELRRSAMACESLYHSPFRGTFSSAEVRGCSRASPLEA